MDNMADKIGSILSDEESLKQIMELADMFKNGFGSSDSSNENFSDAENTQKSENSDESSGFSFGDILGNIDPLLIMSLISEFSSSDVHCDLISALRPLLSEEKRVKADKAIKMLKIYRIYTTLKESGALKNLNLF